MAKPGDNPDDIAIIGWSISPMERHTGKTEAQLLNEVISGAVDDAGIDHAAKVLAQLTS